MGLKDCSGVNTVDFHRPLQHIKLAQDRFGKIFRSLQALMLITQIVALRFYYPDSCSEVLGLLGIFQAGFTREIDWAIRKSKVQLNCTMAIIKWYLKYWICYIYLCIRYSSICFFLVQNLLHFQTKNYTEYELTSKLLNKRGELSFIIYHIGH